MQNDKATSTDLASFQKREELIISDGGTCDLTPVFRLSNCVDMFQECHTRLFDRILIATDGGGPGGEGISYLSSILDCFRLRDERETSLRKAKLHKSICQRIPRDHPGKVSPGRRIGTVFTKSGGGGQRDTYRRGPLGTVGPRKRPDFHAKRSLLNDRHTEIVQHGTKNGKNNKKQKKRHSA